MRSIVPLLAVTLFLPSGAAAQAADAKPDLGANAALKYWQAFGLLPKLDKHDQQILEKWQTTGFDAAALKLIERSRLSLLYLERAAKLSRCDWSLDYEDGVNLLLPHLPKARTLASLAALHARRGFEQGHWEAGANDVAAILQMARHLETDPPMIIQHLVGFALERVAIQTAAPYLPELKAVLPGLVSEPLKELARATPLRLMVLKEKQIGAEWFLTEIKKAERHKPGSWRDLWKHVLGAPGDGERVDPNLVKSANTFDEAVKRLEDLLPRYDELAKVSALPWKDFDAKYPDFIKKAKADNPLAGYVLPNMGRLAPMERRAQTQRELFKAALAVVQGGPDSLKNFRDPFGNGPFEYRRLDQGFELRSSLVVNGMPVTLTVGQAKKE